MVAVFYGLVHYPSIDTERIDRFRRKHDPLVDSIEPHITIVFPVPRSVGKEGLDHRCLLDKPHLVKITDDVSQIERDKELLLPT